MTQDPSPMLGVLSLEKLFTGSKSEGLYPVFQTQDGTRYRIRLVGTGGSGADPLLDFYGQTVRISGLTDRLRGHWRMTLQTGESGVSGIEVLPVDQQGGD